MKRFGKSKKPSFLDVFEQHEREAKDNRRLIDLKGSAHGSAGGGGEYEPPVFNTPTEHSPGATKDSASGRTERVEISDDDSGLNAANSNQGSRSNHNKVKQRIADLEFDLDDGGMKMNKPKPSNLSRRAMFFRSSSEQRLNTGRAAMMGAASMSLSQRDLMATISLDDAPDTPVGHAENAQQQQSPKGGRMGGLLLFGRMGSRRKLMQKSKDSITAKATAPDVVEPAVSKVPSNEDNTTFHQLTLEKRAMLDEDDNDNELSSPASDKSPLPPAESSVKAVDIDIDEDEITDCDKDDDDGDDDDAPVSSAQQEEQEEEQDEERSVASTRSAQGRTRAPSPLPEGPVPSHLSGGTEATTDRQQADEVVKDTARKPPKKKPSRRRASISIGESDHMPKTLHRGSMHGSLSSGSFHLTKPSGHERPKKPKKKPPDKKASAEGGRERKTTKKSSRNPDQRRLRPSKKTSFKNAKNDPEDDPLVGKIVDPELSVPVQEEVKKLLHIPSKGSKTASGKQALREKARRNKEAKQTSPEKTIPKRDRQRSSRVPMSPRPRQGSALKGGSSSKARSSKGPPAMKKSLSDKNPEQAPDSPYSISNDSAIQEVSDNNLLTESQHSTQSKNRGSRNNNNPAIEPNSPPTSPESGNSRQSLPSEAVDESPLRSPRHKPRVGNNGSQSSFPPRSPQSSSVNVLSTNLASSPPITPAGSTSSRSRRRHNSGGKSAGASSAAEVAVASTIITGVRNGPASPRSRRRGSGTHQPISKELAQALSPIPKDDDEEGKNQQMEDDRKHADPYSSRDSGTGDQGGVSSSAELSTFNNDETPPSLPGISDHHDTNPRHDLSASQIGAVEGRADSIVPSRQNETPPAVESCDNARPLHTANSVATAEEDVSRGSAVPSQFSPKNVSLKIRGLIQRFNPPQPSLHDENAANHGGENAGPTSHTAMQNNEVMSNSVGPAGTGSTAIFSMFKGAANTTPSSLPQSGASEVPANSTGGGIRGLPQPSPQIGAAANNVNPLQASLQSKAFGDGNSNQLQAALQSRSFGDGNPGSQHSASQPTPQVSAATDNINPLQASLQKRSFGDGISDSKHSTSQPTPQVGAATNNVNPGSQHSASQPTPQVSAATNNINPLQASLQNRSFGDGISGSQHSTSQPTPQVDAVTTNNVNPGPQHSASQPTPHVSTATNNVNPLQDSLQNRSFGDGVSGSQNSTSQPTPQVGAATNNENPGPQHSASQPTSHVSAATNPLQDSLQNRSFGDGISGSQNSTSQPTPQVGAATNNVNPGSQPSASQPTPHVSAATNDINPLQASLQNRSFGNGISGSQNSTSQPTPQVGAATNNVNPPQASSQSRSTLGLQNSASLQEAMKYHSGNNMDALPQNDGVVERGGSGEFMVDPTQAQGLPRNGALGDGGNVGFDGGNQSGAGSTEFEFEESRLSKAQNESQRLSHELAQSKSRLAKGRQEIEHIELEIMSLKERLSQLEKRRLEMMGGMK